MIRFSSSTVATGLHLKRWVAWLSALWWITGCASAEPVRRPEPQTVHITPAPKTSVAALAASDTTPAGYVPMSVGVVSDEADVPYVVFEGEPGSFVAFRPEAGPELSDVAAAVLFPVPPQASQFVRELREGRLSPKTQEPYEAWSRELLATGAAFIRAEFSLRRDLQGDDVPPGGIGQLRLLVRRGGRVEAVDPGDNAVPVILLHKIPLFVEIKLLGQIGGMKQDNR